MSCQYGRKRCHCIFQTFCERQFFGPQPRITRITSRIARIIGSERRGTDIVAPAPQLRLFHAVTLCGLGFVQALERAVVSLVETPTVVYRDPHEIHFFQRQPQRLNGALEHRGIRDVEHIPFATQDAARFHCFLDSLLAQPDIGPAGETIFFVPRTLTVAE